MDPVRQIGSVGKTDLLRPESSSPTPARDGADFLQALKGALSAVNASQHGAAELAKQFQLNRDDVSLEETMVALQKANISFQALVQVRNKLISAYHEIMNMQV